MKKQIKILLLYGLLLLLFPFSVFALTGSIDELQRLFGGEHTLGATVLFPGGGGTGTSTAPTAGQLLRGKSTGVYELLATSTDGSVLWLDTNGYPAWAATSSLGVVGIVSTSTVPTISQLAYWTSAGTPSTLGTVATTSLTATSPLSLSQPISVIGGSASALSLSTAGDWTGTFDSQEGSYYLNANNLTNFGTPFWTFFNATTTTALAEGNNLYWTNNRFDTRLTATTTLPNLAILLGLTNASSTLLTTTGSTYLATTGGNVGIGTTTPASILHIQSPVNTNTGLSINTISTAGASQIIFQEDSVAKAYVEYVNSTFVTAARRNNLELYNAMTGGQITFHTDNNATPDMVIDSGNVGIGTTGPTYNLDVSENSALASSYSDFPVIRAINPSTGTHSFAAIEVSGNNTTVVGDFLVDGLGTGSAILGSDAGVILMSRSNHILALGTNNTEKLRIDTSGNVGIGTTGPAQKLHIVGNVEVQNDYPRIVLDDTGTGGGNRGWKSDAGNLTAFAGDIGTETDLVTITSTGNVGIGTTSPSRSLEVYKSGALNYVRIDADAAQQAGLEFTKGSTQKWVEYVPESSNDLRFYDGTADRVTFQSGGNVGIGTTTPEYPLQVRRAGGAGSLGISVNNVMSASARDSVYYAVGDATTDLTGHAFYVRNGSATDVFALGINNTGNVGIGTTTPASLLNIASTLPRFYLSDTDFATNGHWFMENDAGVFSLGTTSSALSVSATRALSITNAGNLGIGTTGPGAKLEVRDTGDFGSVAFITEGGFGSYIQGSTEGWTNGFIGNFKYNFTTESLSSTPYTAAGEGIKLDGTNGIRFFSSNPGGAGNFSPTERIRITKTGNVGIGTTTPNSLLNIASTLPRFYLSDTDFATNGHWFMENDAGVFSLGTTSSALAVSATRALSITNAGNVGIGTTGPIGKLHSKDATFHTETGGSAGGAGVFESSYTALNSNIATFIASNAATDVQLNVYPAALNVAGIQARKYTAAGTINLALQPDGGNVGIGTTSPTTLIQAGSTATTTISALSSSGDKGGRLILMDTNGSTCTEITTNAGAIIGKVVTCP